MDRSTGDTDVEVSEPGCASFGVEFIVALFKLAQEASNKDPISTHRLRAVAAKRFGLRLAANACLPPSFVLKIKRVFVIARDSVLIQWPDAR